MKFLQKLGKALMLPVAVLPICGILMGIGYWLCPATMQGGDIQGAANLIFIYFFYFHATTLPFCLRIGMVYSLYFPYILVNRRSSLFKKI